MKIWLKKLGYLIKDERGSILGIEALLLILGVVVVSGVTLKTLSNPLKSFHQGTTKNITKVSRGF